jgi:hypothetical protein
MSDTLLAEILDWSKDRPAWQRDALRQIFSSAKINSDELDELVVLCKAARGLSDPKAARVLTEEHLAVQSRSSAAITLTSVTHGHGVNALAPNQTITFGPNLTVVYGQNAAGKSGYTRILKRACRSRGTEEILGDVLSGSAPLKAQATIRYRDGAREEQFVWAPDVAANSELGAVSVFDAYCAPVYLREKTDVAFRPFSLDVFDKLSAVCGEVRTRLESEFAKLSAIVAKLPVLAEGTRAHLLVARITSLTNVDELRTLAMLTPEEQRHLTELKDRQRDLQATDPKQRARELELKAERVDLLANHVTVLVKALGHEGYGTLRAAADSLRGARENLMVLRATALSADLLPGSGEEAWRSMWDAARQFSSAAYPAMPFPVLQEGAVCPFCQQAIGSDASVRLKYFAEYVSSNAQANVREAEAAYSQVFSAVAQINVKSPEIELATNELLADDADLGGKLRELLDDAVLIQQDAKSAAEAGSHPARELQTGIEGNLISAAKKLRGRATTLKQQSPTLDPKSATDLRELEARAALGEHLQDVINEVERQKRIAAYQQCIEDTQTQAITRKSTELTKRLITDELRTAFRSELSKLDFNQLAVEIQAAGGARGTLFHRLTFTNAPGVGVNEVVSEGESRTLSLAAFLTELSTASGKSAIIFDDPVSSLDHMWRERIARRLVIEAKERQVIVFTHDIIFLRLLLDEAAKQEVTCAKQYVRREGQAGISSADLPWFAMGIKDRIGALHKQYQVAEKLFRTKGVEAYEREAREIYGFLREAWEQAIGETLLNDVVQRYRHSIETRRVRYLHDITEADCRAVDEGMTECSRWIRGHDQPAADAAPVPKLAELKRRIDDLDGFVKAIEKRRRN